MAQATRLVCTTGCTTARLCPVHSVELELGLCARRLCRLCLLLLLALFSDGTVPIDVAADGHGKGVLAIGDRITVEISSERDGLSNWQPQVRVMDRTGYGLRWGQYWGGV